MKYRCIALDPPWLERGGGKSKRGADRHYPLMKTADIVDTVADALGMAEQLDAFTGNKTWFHDGSKVADSAHCWIWVTDNFLEDGLLLMSELDFRYVRTVVWVKWDTVKWLKFIARSFLRLVVRALPGDFLQIGLGQYARGAHELCLLGVRGKACLPPTDKRHPSVIFAPRTEHSKKPQAAYDLFADTSPGPRLEMFARGPREGWDVWGNESNG